CLRHSALLLHSLSSLCPLSFPLFITRSPLVRNLSPSLRLCLALYGSHSFSEVFLGHFVTMPKEHQTNPPYTLEWLTQVTILILAEFHIHMPPNIRRKIDFFSFFTDI